MSQPQADRYWIVPRDKPGLLRAMIVFLAGDAHIAFEGDLSNCSFPAELSPSPDESSVLSRQTIHPRQDFVILPLEKETIRPILDVVLPHQRFMRDLVHIQIEKRGALQFGAYDHFHDECIVCFVGVPTDRLDDLKANGVIRSWGVV